MATWGFFPRSLEISLNTVHSCGYMGVLWPLWPHMPASFMALNSFLIFATNLQIIYPYQFPYTHISSQPTSNTCLQQPYSWYKNKGISALQAKYAPFFHKFCKVLFFPLTCYQMKLLCWNFSYNIFCNLTIRQHIWQIHS